MKPYILNYSESIRIKESPYRYDATQQINQPSDQWPTESTIFTATVETDDHDELQATSTIESRTIEATDDDAILFGSTLITKTFEPIDDDEISTSENFNNTRTNHSTTVTETIEPIDPDEVYLN